MRKFGSKCSIWMLVIAPAVVVLYVYTFMLLWNFLITDIFALRFITFWEALGLLALAKLVFMTAHKGKNKCNCSCKIGGDEKPNFKERMREHFTSKYCSDSNSKKEE